MGERGSRAAELGEVVGALAAQSVAIQRRFDAAFFDAVDGYHDELDRREIPAGFPLRRALQPRLQMLDEFRAAVSLRTEVRRRTEFDVGLRIFGSTVSSFLRRVTESKETEETQLEITVVRSPAPVVELPDESEKGR